MKTHIKQRDIPLENVDEGISRQILGHDTNVMLVRVHFKKGSIGRAHRHPHQQVTYIEQGRFKVEIDGKKEILEAGDSFIVPSDAIHEVFCLEQGVLIDTFSPAREDFLKE